MRLPNIPDEKGIETDRYLQQNYRSFEIYSPYEKGIDNLISIRYNIIGAWPVCACLCQQQTGAQILDTINQMKAIGFDCFKMKVGLDLQHDLERLTFIRKAIGNEAKLMLDANQIWGVDEAINYMRELAQFRPTWIEEPTARDDVLGYVKIAQELAKYNIGVAAGEQVPSPVIFKQLLTSGAISYCQIDATRLAGVNDVLAVILIASKYGIPVCPHGGGIGLCSQAQQFTS